MLADIIYRFFILPLEYIIETAFYILLCAFKHNAGIALIGLGLCISVFTLPLYLRADEIQKDIVQKDTDMRAWVKHIKKCFAGDERLMMLSRYYSIVGYRPTDTVKTVLPLLLQIPFFIAAYHFLSSTDVLAEQSFLRINDLAEADGLLVWGSVKVNILPILMTVINIAAALIYTRGMDIKQKIQPWVLAGVFLVLLYNSPSGLVIYWITNNLFSFIKNILQTVIKKKEGVNAEAVRRQEWRYSTIIVAEAALTILNGLLIPLMTISSSPGDFIDPYHYVSPFHYCRSNLLAFAGMFLFWGSIIYYMLKETGKRIYRVLIYCLLVIGVLVYATMGHSLGLISNALVYEKFEMHPEKEVLIGCWILLAIPAVVIYLYKHEKILRMLASAILITCIVLGVYEYVGIGRYLDTVEIREGVDPSKESLVVLGKNQRNVIVLMMDRAISNYLPFIMEENPILYEQFSGFTWYPNTVSPGACTWIGAPCVYGGYEYTPEAMQLKASESYGDKMAEALLVMPVLFRNAGDRVTVCDNPYEEAIWDSPKSVYRSYGINNVTTKGRYVEELNDKETVERNFFFYSIFRTIIPMTADALYDGGYYLSCGQRKEADDVFMSNYSVLENLPALTVIDDELTTDSVLILANETTHSPHLLRTPDYRPDPSIRKEGYEYPGTVYANGMSLELNNYPQTAHYHANAAAWLRLGEWFDVLRSEGVWDNTRVIIVSDHGDDLGHLARLNGGGSVEAVNAMLMVKDFNDKDFKISYEFMTNADVPSIALKGMINDPTNPFTGMKVDNKAKEHPVKVFMSKDTNDMLYDNGVDYAFDLSKDPVYRVSGNIFEADNWELVEQ